ncbi:hypothetical protein CAQU_05955 [Corynebacterium aquilae DSM 44791]|uniref:Uncharacterized protein n=2 Tax=Corynebacterium aquilae TaxID=203263 RepID=A0A1L7CFS1_9CORY|nr:hypothetical protein CAQU_05955 [Corynebacterium aquilae DSM 44791]
MHIPTVTTSYVIYDDSHVEKLARLLTYGSVIIFLLGLGIFIYLSRRGVRGILRAPVLILAFLIGIGGITVAELYRVDVAHIAQLRAKDEHLHDTFNQSAGDNVAVITLLTGKREEKQQAIDDAIAETVRHAIITTAREQGKIAQMSEDQTPGKVNYRLENTTGDAQECETKYVSNDEPPTQLAVGREDVGPEVIYQIKTKTETTCQENSPAR